MEIKITCTGAGVEDYRELIDIQGNLKERTEEDIENTINSIIKHGWSFPFFVWVGEESKYVLDGHGRLLALVKLEEMGYNIPLLPTVYILAKDIKEAKVKLLKLNARYGTLTQAGYELFTSEMSQMDLEGVSIKFDIPKKIVVDREDYVDNEESLEQFGDSEISITCPGCMEESFFTIRELLKLLEAEVAVLP